MNIIDPFTKIEDLGEFAFIESIQDDCLFSTDGVIKGIGDDCAVIEAYDGEVFLITKDLLVDHVHFLLDRIPPDHLGHKAVAVNLSDIAAMGGTPLHLILGLAIPPAIQMGTLHALYSGIKGLCRRYGVNILGGDTVASPDRLMISVTAVGKVPGDEVLYRSGAGPENKIYVTGTLGDSAAGLQLIRNGARASEDISFTLVAAHNLPVPSLEAGRLIAKSRLASAMIDLSDGLVSDLRHICRASSVGARLFEQNLPLSDELKKFSELNGSDPYRLALHGGEDYRLLVTVPRRNARAFENLFINGNPCRAFYIGETVPEAGIRLLRSDGSEQVVEPSGFSHFDRP